MGGVKVFELTAKKIQWETEPGHIVEAWAYNDQVPGPQIRVTQGDRVRVILHNAASRIDGRFTFTGSSCRTPWTACRSSPSRR